MKLAFVSTWPPTACGLATYTEHIVRALVAGGTAPVTVLSEEGGDLAIEGVDVHPVFSRRRPFAAPIVEAAVRLGVDVVHVQHAPDILGMGAELMALLQGLRSHGVRTVVTLHTVYDTWSGLIERKPHARSFHRALGVAADRILVHQPSMVATLVGHGVPPERLALVPHGTDRLGGGQGPRVRALHGVPPEAPLLLFFGFVHVQKNVHTLLKAMPAILARLPEARLLVAGSVAGGTWYNRAYAWYLDRLVRTLGLGQRVVLTKQFVDAADVEGTYAAADLVLLPHQQGYGSASGVLHQAIGAGKPLLASDVPKFEELKEIGADLLVPTTDARAWAERAVRLLTDADWREPRVQRLQAYAETTRWEAIARRHLDLYATLPHEPVAPALQVR